MYNFFRRNQKKLLGLFAVVLMVTWLQPNFRTASQTRSDQAIGSIGAEQVTREDFDRAELEWEFLARRVVVRAAATGENQWAPVVLAVPQFQDLAVHLRQKPEAFFLLLYDAKQMGFAPEYERAEALLRSPNGDVAIAMPDDTKVAWPDITDETVQLSARQAVADLLMVMDAFQRAMDAVKVSDPLIKHELASRYQQIKSRIVDFTVQDYVHSVPVPTSEELQKQFDRFASKDSGVDKGAENPFGFGYKYPNRVKVQYIGIPRTEVRKAVQAQKDEYAWDVDAHRYYLQHQAEFATTQPATTQPLVLMSATQPAPTTRPFEEVKQTILDRLIEPLANRLQQQLQTQITSRLNQDYQAYAKTAGSTSAPAGSAYESFEYLQKLAADIETRQHVTLTVASVADAFRDHDQLRDLPGIGRVPSFPDYALTVADSFATASVGNSTASVKLFEPSKPLTDEIGSVYVFRVIASDASHQPASIDEIRDRVEQDWKKMHAYELAKADAMKMLEAAREPGLDAASGDHKLITTGFYSTNSMVPIDNYRIATTSQAEFIKQTFALLSLLTEKDHKRPITLVEMPADGKIAVAELIAVDSGLSPQSLDLAKVLIGDQIAQPYAISVLQDWFSYEAVVERLGYKDESHTKRAD